MDSFSSPGTKVKPAGQAFSDSLPSTLPNFSDRASSAGTATDSHGTPTDSTNAAFYDYLLPSNIRKGSKITREVYENLKNQSSVFSEALKTIVPGYTLLSNISNDLYRGFNRVTKRSVLVRYTPYISAGSISRHFNEWYSLSGLNNNLSVSRPRTLPTDIEGVLYPSEFVPLNDNSGYAVIYEDVLNLKSLKEVYVQGLVKDHDKALKTIIQCLKILKIIHSHGFTHNGLTANTILINDNEDVLITGWDFCFSYVAEDCTKGYRTLNKRFLIDWLPYMAPEVSGEINRLADYRADLYSIGVILYQIFVGSLPFFASDGRELINKHIKEIPQDPSALGVPKFLSDVILKLLSKSANERYQDCNLLIDDLEYALTGVPKADLKDEMLKVTLARGIYGREKELALIERICRENKAGVQIVILSGETGTGKTRLLDEVQSTIITSSHYFAKWKCNSKTSGFTCFISILNSIIHQILSSSEEEVMGVRETIILEAGSLDLTYMFSYIPELRDILGVNYSKHIANISENQENFMVKSELKFRHLLKLLFISLGRRRPLILCLDDFQGHSRTELDILSEIRSEIVNSDIDSSIIVIASFDTSVSDGLETLKKDLIDYREIPVGPIAYDCYKQFVRDAISPRFPLRLQDDITRPSIGRVKSGDSSTDAFIEKLYERTNGNLLTTQMVLVDLIVNQNTEFRSSSCSVDIRGFVELSVDITALYHKRLKLFTQKEVELFKITSCFVDKKSFSLSDIVLASAASITEVSEFLSKAIRYKLIFPLNIFYKFPFHLDPSVLPFKIEKAAIEDLSMIAYFSLCHDSFNTFLLNDLMLQDEVLEFHKSTGLRLLNSIDTFDYQMDLTLDIANHFIRSYSKINSKEEAGTFLTVLEAAQKFYYQTFDYSPALKIFKKTALIIQKFGLDNAKLLSVHVEIAKCLLMLKDYEVCVSFIEKHSKSFQDDPKVVLYKIQCLSILGKQSECLELGLRILKKKGIVLIDEEDWKAENIAIAKNKIPKSLNSMREILSNPKVASKSSEIIQQILCEVIFILNSDGNLLLSCIASHLLVSYSLEHGATGYTALGFLGLAMDQLRSNLPSRAKEYLQITENLLKRKNATLDFASKVLYISCATIGTYMSPIKDLLKLHDWIMTSSSQLSTSATLEFAMRVAIRPVMQLMIGMNTHAIHNHLISTVKKSELEIRQNRIWFKTSVTMLRFFLQIPCGEQYDVFKEFGPDDLKNEPLYLRYFYNSVALYSTPKRFDRQQMEKFQEDVDRVNLISPQNLLRNFIYLKFLFSKVDRSHIPIEERKKDLNSIRSLFESCKSFSPDFYQPKILVLEAELLKFENVSDLEILDAYSASIESAREYGLINECSVYNERCASWLYKTNSKKRTIHHLREAVQYARSCGYIAKITEMKEKYPDLFEIAKSEQLNSPSDSRRMSIAGGSLSPLNYLISSVLTKESNVENSVPEFSTEYIINASLAISESINVDSILKNLVSYNISILDAEYAVVALADENNLVEYKAIGSPNLFKYLTNEDNLNLSLPESLIETVIESGETANNFHEISLDFEKILKSDPYFHKFVPKSLLCLPIKNELEVIGAIYLESSKASNLFHDKKVNLVSLLCTQAAFALDKSRLYHSTMLAKRRAEEATEEKTAFLANMSHEIRTPFNSLFACAGFLLDTNLDPIQQEYVETIQSSAQVTLNIIDAILTFSKLEHGSIFLDEETFSINDSIESAMQLLAEQAEDKGLVFAYFNRSRGVDMIRTDPTRFKQVIINLLGNAVKFTDNGSIVVSLDRKIVSDDVYEFVISIKDTGIGIPESSYARIFGAFNQVDGSSRRVHGGSGLGLAISKKLVDLMGGTLTFESAVGDGTTFNFSITSTVDPIVKKVDKVGNGEKVIIIDDIGETTESLRYLLEMLTDFDTDAVRDLSLVKTFENYKVVFLGLKLYHLLSPDLIRTIKDNERLVLLSSYGSTISDDIQARGHNVLFLPIKRTKLESIISSIVSLPTRPKLILRTSENSLKTHAIPERIPPLAQIYPMRILLVEDNVINTRVALQHLKKFGYSADSAAHGIQALEKCTELIERNGYSYDLIFMDLQMPYKDGISTTKELRENYRDRPHLLPVIVALTANVEREERDQCIACGMFDFISKPILPKILEEVLRSVGEIMKRKQ